jgi:hypothetical protein
VKPSDSPKPGRTLPPRRRLRGRAATGNGDGRLAARFSTASTSGVLNLFPSGYRPAP